MNQKVTNFWAEGRGTGCMLAEMALFSGRRRYSSLAAISHLQFLLACGIPLPSPAPLHTSPGPQGLSGGQLVDTRVYGPGLQRRAEEGAVSSPRLGQEASLTLSPLPLSADNLSSPSVDLCALLSKQLPPASPSLPPPIALPGEQ